MDRRDERPPFVTRHAVEDDIPWIHSSWLKSVAQTMPFNFMPREHFVPWQTRIIASCIQSGTTLLAVDPTEPSTLYACLNHIGATVNWLYVRQNLRHMGFADVLMAKVLGTAYRDTPVHTSAWTKHSLWIKDKVRISYEPHVIL